MVQKRKTDAPDPLTEDDLDIFEELEGDGKKAADETPASLEEDLSERDEPSPDEAMHAHDAVQPETKAARNLADELSALAPDVPVNVVAVIGKVKTNVGLLMKYRIGQVIDLARPPGETVDVVANGRLIARGELVEMEVKMGIRILKMVR